MTHFTLRPAIRCVVWLFALLPLHATAAFTTVLDLPPGPDIGDSESIGSDTQLNLGDGGSIGYLFATGSADTPSANIEVNVSGGTIGAGLSLHEGARLNMTGGSVGAFLSVHSGAELNIQGGTIGEHATLLGGTLNLSGGTVGRNFYGYAASQTNVSGGTLLVSGMWGGLRITGGEVGIDKALSGSFTSVSGGKLANSVTATEGSRFHIEGGSVGIRFRAQNGSEIQIDGGDIGGGFSAENGSKVTITGGNFGDQFSATGGASVLNVSGGNFGDFASSANTTISGGRFGDGVRIAYQRALFVGGEFYLDGVRIDGLENSGDSRQISIPSYGILSGMLRDGTSFVFSRSDGDQSAGGLVTLQRAALPNLPATTTLSDNEAPRGLRAGQTIEIESGGELPKNFAAGVGSKVILNGGTTGDNFEAIGAEVTILDGSIGDNSDLFYGGVLNVHGGHVGKNFRAFEGTSVELRGGSIGEGFQIGPNAAFDMTGGILPSLNADYATDIAISGGAFGQIDANATQNLPLLIGGDFRLNGLPIESLRPIGTRETVSFHDGAVLSGTLADGTPFAVSTEIRGSQKSFVLETVALPEVGPAVVQLASKFEQHGVREGQALVVHPDGEVLPYFNLGRGSQLEAKGGNVGNNLRAFSATIDLHEGHIGERAELLEGTVLRITGGTIGGGMTVRDSSLVVSEGDIGAIDGQTFELTDRSEAHFTGGRVGHVALTHGSTLTISGDAQVGEIQVLSGSTIDMSGGASQQIAVWELGQVTISGGALGRVYTGGDGKLKLIGNQFRLNGNSLPTLEEGQVLTPVGPSFEIEELSGVLADGTPFYFNLFDEDLVGHGLVELIGAQIPVKEPIAYHVPGPERPRHISAGQSLSLREGGELPNYFTAYESGAVLIEGGTVGNGLEIIRSSFTMHGGEIGDDFDVFQSDHVVITGGVVGDGFCVHADSTVNISGGTFGDDFDARAGSTISITGGVFGDGFGPRTGSVVHISGGEFGDRFMPRGGQVNLLGTQFILGGVDITDTLALGVPLTITKRNVSLQGVFADGTLFDFQLNSTQGKGDYFPTNTLLTVSISVPEPEAAGLLGSLLGFAIAFMGFRSRLANNRLRR